MHNNLKMGYEIIPSPMKYSEDFIVKALSRTADKNQGPIMSTAHKIHVLPSST